MKLMSWSVGLGLGLVLGLGACKRGSAPEVQGPKNNALMVTVQPAQARTIARFIPVTGTLNGEEEIMLSNRVTGVVEQVLVDVGAVVHPDQPLANIDSQRYDLLVKQAQSNQTQTLARLGLTAVPMDNYDVDQVASVRKAAAELANAKIKMDRANDLYKQRIMTDFEYADLSTTYQSRQNALDAARDEAKALLQQVRNQQAQIELANKDLRDSVLKAPRATTIEGQIIANYVVAQRQISAGEYLKEGSMTFKLIAQSTLKIETRLPERYLAQITKGQKLEFQVSAYPDQTFTGEISLIDPAVDITNRSFRMEARVNNEAGKLHAGSFIEGRIILGEANTVFVPVESLTTYASVTRVFVVDSDPAGQLVARPVEVQAGQQNGTWVEIPAGVQANDRIVVTGQSKLSAGTAVQIATPATTSTRPQ